MFSRKTNFRMQGYKKYQELSDVEVMESYDKIIDRWQSFLAQNDPTLRVDIDYFIHKKNMFEIIRRCHRRQAYYYFFHGLEDICEYKNVAIFCFWINTLKPFMVIKEEASIYNCANEMFSLFLILAVIEGVFYEVYVNDATKVFEYPSPERIKDIIYDFKYCSLSREAMISFVETFADTYGVGINHILNHSGM